MDYTFELERMARHGGDPDEEDRTILLAAAQEINRLEVEIFNVRYTVDVRNAEIKRLRGIIERVRMVHVTHERAGWVRDTINKADLFAILDEVDE